MEYDGRIWCRTIPLIDQQRGKILLFTSYVLAGLTLPASSFLMLLENYDLWLHHLSQRSLMLVVIFVQFCQMYVGVQPSVHLFCLFFTL
jgi:hypothetical protein